jgi:2-succinyl-6-hydroxy-2,4-cyclohexadiene-1-carboxylate synthase
VLSARSSGTAAGDPVVLLHGFTQTAHSWAPIAPALGQSRAVVALDAPGHGGSSAIEADLWAGARLMLEAAAKAATPPAAWVGYSMGGRYALHIALADPEAVERLVLVSATAGIDDPRERAERRARDEELAARIETAGVDAFVDWWLQLPMFRTLPADAASRSDRVTNTSAGLASSLRRAGTGTQAPLWDRLSGLHMPVLVVAGALDAAYVAHARRLVDAIGTNAALAVIEDAGHACHLERPAAFIDLVTPFLATTGH